MNKTSNGKIHMIKVENERTLGSEITRKLMFILESNQSGLIFYSFYETRL